MTTTPDKIHRAVRFCIVAVYGVAVGWIAIRAGEPTELWWWLLEIPFFLWIVAPIAVPLLLSLRSWFLTSGVAVMAAYSVYIYERDMFGPGARSTSALIFVFLPVYQWAGAAVLIGLASAASAIGRKASK